MITTLIKCIIKISKTDKKRANYNRKDAYLRVNNGWIVDDIFVVIAVQNIRLYEEKYLYKS